MVWAIISIVIVEVIGVAACGGWGLLAAPVLVGAALLKQVYDQNQLETLHREMLEAREDARIKRENLRAAEAELADAIAKRESVKKMMKQQGWMVPTRDDVQPN